MEQTAFLHILGSIVGIMFFLWVGASISAWLRPQRTHRDRLTTYESGSESLGQARGPVNSRLYVIGLIFLLFEIETILLFPWALVWAEKSITPLADTSWSLYMAILGTLFILVLGLGLIYVLSKWKYIRIDSTSTTQYPHSHPVGPVPLAYYEKINAYYTAQPKSIVQPSTNE